MDTKYYAVPNAPLALSLTTHPGELTREDVVENLLKAMRLSNEYGEDWMADLLYWWYNKSGEIPETPEEDLESEEYMRAEAMYLTDVWEWDEARARALLNTAGWKDKLEPLSEERLEYLNSDSETWTVRTILLEFLPTEEPYY